MFSLRKYINNFSLILVFSTLFILSLVYADTNGVWHEAMDVKPGTIFGSDELNYGDDSTYYTFNNPFRSMKYSQFDSNVTIKGELKVDVISPNSGSSVVIQLG